MIGFDFDGTIRTYDGNPINNVIKLIKEDLTLTNTVCITRRSYEETHAGLDGEGVINFVKENIGDIPVIFTNGNDKWTYIFDNNITLFYDDDETEIEIIKSHLDIQVIYIKDDKSELRNESMSINVEKLKERKKQIYFDKVVMIFDHGLYLYLAHKLSQSFGTVLYHTPWEKSFPISNDTLVGSGFPNIVRVDRFFNWIDKVDLFIFTDIYHSDLQIYLEKLGKRVWGAREGDKMEIYRWDFIQKMKELNMPVPPTELIIGIDKLRERLQEVEDKFIKVDAMTRGDIETFHHINYDITKPVLDKLANAMGPKQNKVRFIIQDKIDAVAEIGYDGYTIDGDFPEVCVIGIEVKDKGYLGEIRNYNEIPKEIREVNDYLSPLFKEYGYKGMFSTEIRLSTDGVAYLIDPTCRFPSPPTATIIELYENIAEIIYEGAGGKLIQPTYTNMFGAEVIGTSDFARDGFIQLFCDDENDIPYIKQPNSFMIDDKTYVIPQQYDMNMVCNVVATGNSIDETIDNLTERIAKIKCHQLSIDVDILKEAIEGFNSL